jgi:hypothetical protein
MKEWTSTATSKNGFETRLRVIYYDTGVMKGAIRFEIGLHQGQDHPRGALIGCPFHLLRPPRQR